MLKFAIALLLCTVATWPSVGGWIELDVKNPYLVAAAGPASQEISNLASYGYNLELYRIVQGGFEDANGLNIDLSLIVGVTECEKLEVGYDEVKTCKFQKRPGTFHKCDVRVFRDSLGKDDIRSGSCREISLDELEVFARQ